MYRYFINVVDSGMFSFPHASAVELVPNQIIHDTSGRAFVVIDVSDETMRDPFDKNIRLTLTTAKRV
jgi:hypothetical protein